MKPENVVFIKFTHPNYTWSNGFLAVIVAVIEDGKKIVISRLIDGFPARFNDGTYMCDCTEISNPEIILTDLKYSLEEFPKYHC